MGAEYQREAARLAAETGAKLIEGYALSASLAGTLARSAPGARAEVDVKGDDRDPQADTTRSQN